MLPNSSALTTGHAREVYDYAIEPHLTGFMGEIFEWIAHQFVAHYGREFLNAPAKKVGKIWSGDYDIDLVATLLDNTMVFGECKWWDSPVGPNILQKLKETSQKTRFSVDPQSTPYLLFSRSGFTKELPEEAATSQSIVLIGPQQLLGL